MEASTKQSPPEDSVKRSWRRDYQQLVCGRPLDKLIVIFYGVFAVNSIVMCIASWSIVLAAGNASAAFGIVYSKLAILFFRFFTTGIRDATPWREIVAIVTYVAGLASMVVGIIFVPVWADPKLNTISKVYIVYYAATLIWQIATLPLVVKVYLITKNVKAQTEPSTNTGGALSFSSTSPAAANYTNQNYAGGQNQDGNGSDRLV